MEDTNEKKPLIKIDKTYFWVSLGLILILIIGLFHFFGEAQYYKSAVKETLITCKKNLTYVGNVCDVNLTAEEIKTKEKMFEAINKGITILGD